MDFKETHIDVTTIPMHDVVLLSLAFLGMFALVIAAAIKSKD